jgi:hypothetical protein
MEQIKISKEEYDELLLYKRQDDNLKSYRRNYYRNRYANDENFRIRRQIANKKYQEKKKKEKKVLFID